MTVIITEENHRTEPLQFFYKILSGFDRFYRSAKPQKTNGF